MNSEAKSDSNLKRPPISGSSASIADQCLKQNVEMSGRGADNEAVCGAPSASYLASDSLMRYLSTSFGNFQNDAYTEVVSPSTFSHFSEKAEVSMNSSSDNVDACFPAMVAPLFTLDPGAAVYNGKQRFEPTQVQNQPQLYTGVPEADRRTPVSRANLWSDTTRPPVHRVTEEPLLKSLSPYSYQSLNFQDSTSPVASIPAPTGATSKRNDTPADSAATATKALKKKRSKRKRPESWVPTSPSYRPYQEKQWTDQFEELLKFKAQHGHCRIPYTSQSNSSLPRWVKRQRYQYKLKQENKASALSDERMKELEEVGFVWDSHGAIWQERRAELEEYKQVNGDCNVPSCYPRNPKLSAWVKCQRRQYKKFIGGQASSMTVDRFATLDRMGFTWKIRGVKGEGKSSPLDLL